MFPVLLATEAVQEAAAEGHSGGPWWVSAILVPFVIVILTNLFTFWVARQTEWYRRLSTWEPYGEQLWREKTQKYCELSGKGWQLTSKAYFLMDMDKAERKSSQEHKDLSRLKSEFVTLLMSCVPLMPPKIFSSAWDFPPALHEAIAKETDARSSLEAAKEFTQKLIDMQTAMRDDLHSEKLGGQMRQMILKTLDKSQRSTGGD